jgi:hypothetical protein
MAKDTEAEEMFLGAIGVLIGMLVLIPVLYVGSLYRTVRLDLDRSQTGDRWLLLISIIGFLASLAVVFSHQSDQALIRVLMVNFKRIYALALIPINFLVLTSLILSRGLIMKAMAHKLNSNIHEGIF